MNTPVRISIAGDEKTRKDKGEENGGLCVDNSRMFDSRMQFARVEFRIASAGIDAD